ncbi:MAG: PIG-L family deacetylase [Anaerolineae bacterium]|nr:PIG-L family deacetylase [Phycisphaerae bacterium]
MIRVDLLNSAKNVLCLGAHSDDIEIGCGATLLRMIEQNPTVNICWVVFSGDEVRRTEAQASAAAYLKPLKGSHIITQNFRDGHFPVAFAEIKQIFEQVKREFSPDLIFTHTREDRHQDHRVIHDLTCNTWRDHAVLEYEIPKFDGDLGHPNVFAAIAHSVLRRKVELLNEHFKSQLDKQWFTEEAFVALPRIRGIECNSPTKYAEAFHARKICL